MLVKSGGEGGRVGRGGDTEDLGGSEGEETGERGGVEVGEEEVLIGAELVGEELVGGDERIATGECGVMGMGGGKEEEGARASFSARHPI
jgi:hypothetical protein